MGRSIVGPLLLRRSTGLAFAISAALAMCAVLIPGQALAASHAKKHAKKHHAYKIRKTGELDCNGYSTRQHSLRLSMSCTDIRGLKGKVNDNTWHGRFFDNGHYIGHDEPDMTFLSNAPNSGNDVTWTETLPHDPTAAPTVSTPGSDVTHWFELSIAPWFSMAQCDSNSYPQLPCTPLSDENAPHGTGAHAYPGGGSAFMEMQFYPPGFAPFADGISCDDTHWCAALNIDSLECTAGFAQCNSACEEPVNFAYLTTNGIPGGPAAPQNTDLATFTPNSKTLLMNPGDHLTIHMSDAPVPGEAGQHAFEVVVHDLTTGQTGFMQASAKNGFQNTSIVDCSGTPHNFEPEYNTAAKGNITPWAALQTNISTQYETGHFEACTSLSDPFTASLFGTPDQSYKYCNGPYEAAGDQRDGGTNPEVSDAFCFNKGDTHGVLNVAPDEVTGCIDDYTQNGDLDFDGSPYWADWPTSATPTAKFPGSFVEQLPATEGRSYSQYFIQTDLALSESTCTGSTPSGCSVPPPNAPGHFYPYWSRVGSGTSCVIEFGNVSSGSGVHDFGKDAQYGTNQAGTLGYPEFEGPVFNNSSCGV
jgi:uncharacterized membrane protein